MYTGTLTRSERKQLTEQYYSINFDIAKQYYESLLKDEPDILAMLDVARISGYNPKVVHRWTLSGELNYFEIKRKKYVAKNELIRYMSSQRHIGKVKKPEKHRKQLSEILNSASYDL